MRFNQLGRSGLIVSELCLGTMTFGGQDGMWGRIGQLQQDEADGLVKAALDAGINFFDTANVYSEGRSETILGQALKNLGVRRGVVRYIGLSNWAAWQVMKAVGIAAAKGYASIASLQAYYTIAGRDLERDVVPMLQSEGVGLMVWSPLAGGFLSGKYTREGEGEGRRAGFDFPPIDKERGYDVVDVLRELSEAKDQSVAQLALGWLLHQKAVSSVILGAKRPDQLADNLGAVEVSFTAEELARLDAVSKLPAEYPGWMIERQGGYRGGPSPRR